MGGKIKKAAMVAAPVAWVANKGLASLAKGKNAVKTLANDFSSLRGGGGGDEGYSSDPNILAAQQAAERAAAQDRLAALVQRAKDQAPIDRAKIVGYGAEEENKAGEQNAGYMDMRRQRRGELATLLSKQADDTFKLSQPEIAESANSAGILASSGYGEALAREKARLATDRENKLAENALTDVDADISGRQGVDTLGRGYRDSALSREFGLEDYAREGEVSKEMAAMQTPGSGAVTAPSVGGGGKGGMMGGATQGAAAGSTFGPWGALIGGGAGAILGNDQKKKGK